MLMLTARFINRLSWFEMGNCLGEYTVFPVVTQFSRSFENTSQTPGFRETLAFYETQGFHGILLNYEVVV